MYDIAREAKVSVATVSRVLNGTAPVKDSTRERINKIIEKYQFQPNALARSLLKKKTGMIGMILPNIHNPFFPEVFAGAEEEARRIGSTLFLGDSMGDHERESEYLSAMREKQVDGILFMGGRINLQRCDAQLQREIIELSERIPVVLINGNLPKGRLPRVYTDEYAAAVMATRHLIELGHRRIGFLGGMARFATTTVKIRAYRKTIKEHGLIADDRWILLDDFSIESGKKLMNRLLQLKERPTAIICINDFTAIGALKVALEHGLRIPEDMSIVGFDDTLLATAVTPELTTVTQNAVELGRSAVRLLQQLIDKGPRVKKQIVLNPKLIVRQTTGPVGSTAAEPL